MKEELMFNIVEIFSSMQGEGYNTGMDSIFIRFGKCNLNCPWCDTNYADYTRISIAGILEQIHQYKAKNVVITGGEPTIQKHLDVLLKVLKEEGYYIAMETNGLITPPDEVDYIATSPKRIYSSLYDKRHLKKANEVRIVVDGDIVEFCHKMEDMISAERYYLSPCENDGEFNMRDTLNMISKLNKRIYKNHWNLSIQAHKIAQIN